MEYLRIGIVIKPQGVRGELKVMPLTDDPNRFKGLKSVFVERTGEYVERQVQSVSVRDDAVVLLLDIAQDRDTAEKLRGAYLCVDRAHAVKLPEGRYFVVDLIGCAVEDSGGKPLGTLTQVIETGANDVYQIEGERSLLVPAIKKLLVSVDVASKRIVLDAAVLEEVAVWDEI